MADSFYPFTAQEGNAGAQPLLAASEARIAVYDDISVAPHVVTVKPQEIRAYLEELTTTIVRLVKEQGGNLPFMVIRECVENLIHAYFRSPTISILDNGNTLRFSDCGPGIQNKTLALEFGSTSATDEMKQYIRGVGSGLPYAQNYLLDKGGSLTIEDNINEGCIVTISLLQKDIAKKKSPSVLHTTVSQDSHVKPSSQNQRNHIFPAYTQKNSITNREVQALQYLLDHRCCGSKELSCALGSSIPTWSRCLQSLLKKGLVSKGTQKYNISEAGIVWLKTH